jgi:hypothetical protein
VEVCAAEAAAVLEGSAVEALVDSVAVVDHSEAVVQAGDGKIF